MKLDIVIVTYNSSKWLDECINSIENSKNINLEDIYLHVIDNVSTDDTIEVLENLKNNTNLGLFNIIKSTKNLGFGKANNEAAKHAKSDYIFFLNPDTKFEQDTLFKLFREIENSNDDIAVWELRQRPYEHPKYYDILTGETSWVSGACFVVKKDIFLAVGGFDKRIFMYAEDVDLSWNIRLNGYKLKYLPNVTLYHYCYKTANEIKPVQYFYSIINNLNLRLKYGNYRKVARWYAEFYKILRRSGPFKGSRKKLFYLFIKNLKNTYYYAHWKHTKQNRDKIKNFHPNFFMFDYELNRLGSFIDNNDFDDRPLVSVIVRTCGRKNVLRECLLSLKKQTYDNIEVVVVEDGDNLSEKMIKDEFSTLNIKYIATNTKVGRCKAGNIGLENSTGKYCNFLDDDDLFFADHVETLVKKLVENSEYKAAYAVSYESKIEVIRKEPIYEYKEYSKIPVHDKPFSRITLLTRNAFPIQCVMFSRELYEKYGGFDVELDNLEDWELWARYSLENRFLYVQKVTSLYRVPYSTEDYEKRQKDIDYYYNMAKDKIWSRNLVAKPKDILEEIRHI